MEIAEFDMHVPAAMQWLTNLSILSVQGTQIAGLRVSILGIAAVVLGKYLVFWYLDPEGLKLRPMGAFLGI